MRGFGAWMSLAALAASSLPAAADIYVWRDRYGVSHYTNDLANIPAEYRESAYPVARDWPRPPPPPEPVEPPAAPTATPEPRVAAPEEEPQAQSGLFEAGYLAGLRAAEAAGATAIASATAIPLIVLAPEPRRGLFVHGLFPGGRPLPPLRRPDRKPRHAEPPPFQGPAGPPPLGAPGPPPFQPFSR
jgi:hypothetical protein